MARAVGSRPVTIRPGQALHEPFQPAGSDLAPAPMRADGMQFLAIAPDGGSPSAMHAAAAMAAHPDGLAALARHARHRDAAQFRGPVHERAFPEQAVAVRWAEHMTL